ncbi:MAG: hypothetical protein SCK29_05435 [Bacillota bacterium]|nr:hypothetical protein [Bacillota bacterium]MDW7683546.1 hypothetical protein [Bacillota bacterium]
MIIALPTTDNGKKISGHFGRSCKAFTDLSETGKTVLLTAELDCDKAVSDFLNDGLQTHTDSFCGCDH